MVSEWKQKKTDDIVSGMIMWASSHCEEKTLKLSLTWAHLILGVQEEHVKDSKICVYVE